MTTLRRLWRLTLRIAVCLTLWSLTSRAAASGVDPTKISLPKGPGSIEGLGRNFVPSLASGTAGFGVDIAVPPAVGGFGPKLSLEYDAGGGVSELGLGWRIGALPSIRRRVDDGLPRFDTSDAFELSGVGVPSDLVEVEPGVFRQKYEAGAFVRVQRSADGATWEARLKNGFTLRFGGSGYTEEESGRVVTYLLAEELDLHGHRIAYSWDTSDGHALLESVRWNEQSDAVRLEIVLSYETRPDVYERFSSGIRQVIARRLKRIDVMRGGELVRRYDLTYRPGTRSTLTSIQVFGSDGVTSLPPLALDYTEPALANGEMVTMTSPPGRSPAEADVELADLNGDGLPDLLVGVAGQYRSYVNHDGRAWQAPQDWTISDSPSVSLSSVGVQLADLDGDGAIDLVAKSGTTSFRYFPGLSGTSFAPSVAIQTVPNFTFEDPDVRLADMDGDRRTDVVITTAAGLAIGYNLGGQNWTVPETVGVIDANQPLRFSDGHTRLADVNGDRIQDFCYLRSGSLVYWLGRGRGQFEPARTATGVPSFDESDPYQLHDLNGDGWVDLVHVGVTEVSYALAEGAAAELGPIHAIASVPEKGPSTSVEFADVNGSGTIDIVWIDVTGSVDTAWRYLELFPDGRAGLLRQIDNGLGKVARITYEPAALHAARARDAGTPWTTRINVAMPVVRRTEVDSSLGDPLLISELEYRDGTWDAKDRTFAGFADGILREIGDESQPTLIAENTFDTGLVTRSLRGAVLTAEQRDETGRIFSRSSNTYTARIVGTGLNGEPIEYAYRSAERGEHVEGSDPAAARVTFSEWVEDDYGNVTEERRWGEISLDGTDRLVGDDEVVIRRTFAQNLQDWLLGFVATQEVLNARDERLALKRNYYDGEPLAGLALGEVARGDLRRVESWIERDHFSDDARYDHDEHGNVIAAIDVRGGRGEFDYDPESHTFVVAERRIIAPGNILEWKAEYDRRYGAVLRAEGANREVSQYGYDALGRLLWMANPGDSQEFPTRSFEYVLNAPVSLIRENARERTGDAQTRAQVSYFDGLGRKRAELEEGDEAGTWVIESLGAYGARGKARFAARNSVERSADLPSIEGREGTELFYDALLRETRTRFVDGSETRVEYFPFGKRVFDENDNDESSPLFNTPITYYSDGLGRLRQVVETTGQSDVTSGSYEYDALGNLTHATDAAGHTREYRYDGRSRRFSLTDPNAGTWQFEFSDGNDLLRRMDPSGRLVRFEYDTVARPTKEFHQLPGEAETLVAELHYDAPSSAHAELKNQRGRLAWVRDQAGEVYFGYTPRGLESERIRRYADGQQFVSWSDFDAADRLVRRGFPNKTHYEVEYNARGLIAKVGPFANGVRYTPHGDLSEARLGNGVVETREYDRRERLELQRATGPGDATIRALRLYYDRGSLVRDIEDLAPGPDPAFELTTHYDYDSRERLIQASDRVGTTSWSYDVMSNILLVASAHPDPALNVENRFGENGTGPDQLTHFGDRELRYDEAGRLADDTDRRFTWDAKGRLVRVEQGDVVEEYVYGYDDKRAVKRTTQGGKTSVVRYPTEDAEERDGALVRYVSLAGERLLRMDAVPEATRAATPAGPERFWPLTQLGVLLLALLGVLHAVGRTGVARRREASVHPYRSRPAHALRFACALIPLLLIPGCLCSEDETSTNAPDPRADSRRIDELPETAVFYSSDFQESPLALTNAKGEVVRETRFHPYGMVRAERGAPDPFAYVGNERDKAVGLNDFNARPYDTRFAIFLKPDPVSVFTPESVLDSPIDLCAYGYAAGNPASESDPTGNCKWCQKLWDTTKAAAKEYVVAKVEAQAERMKLLVPGVAGIEAVKAGIQLVQAVKKDPKAAAVAAVKSQVPDAAKRIVASVRSVQKGDFKAAGRHLARAQVALEQKAEEALAVVATSGAVGGAGAARSMSTASARRVAVAQSGVCFTSGTRVETASGLEPIETLAVGDRVLTSGDALTEQQETDPCGPSWRHVTIRMPDPRGSGDVFELELLRPAAWLDTLGGTVGATLALALPEMGLRGPAQILGVGLPHCSPEHSGSVVTGTIRSRSSTVLVLRFAGSAETLEPTEGHRLFSVDRDEWVPAGKLTVGERLLGHEGPVEIAAIARKPGVHRVFNIEVQGEHTYWVSELGVLSHNQTSCAGRGLKPLPSLDRTGKVHGELPAARDLGGYSIDELRQLQAELQQSVQKRIETTVRLGPDKPHGERQAAEQKLIRHIEKHLEDRQ